MRWRHMKPLPKRRSEGLSAAALFVRRTVVGYPSVSHKTLLWPSRGKHYEPDQGMFGWLGSDFFQRFETGRILVEQLTNCRSNGQPQHASHYYADVLNVHARRILTWFPRVAG